MTTHTWTGPLKIEGTYTFPGTQQDVWDRLLNPATLQSCIPGVKQLTPIGDDQYEVTMTVGVAAVKGTYKGKVAITERDEPNSYTMRVEGSGGPGFVKGTARIKLAANGEESTSVSVDADGQIGGPVAGVGQRMIGGVGKMLMNQFFDCMSKKVESAA